MARHSRDVISLEVQEKLKSALFHLSSAINGKEIDEEGLVVPKEFVDKLLVDYHEEEQYELCNLVKKFLDSKPSYVKDITAKEWVEHYKKK